MAMKVESEGESWSCKEDGLSWYSLESKRESENKSCKKGDLSWYYIKCGCKMLSYHDMALNNTSPLLCDQYILMMRFDRQSFWINFHFKIFDQVAPPLCRIVDEQVKLKLFWGVRMEVVVVCVRGGGAVKSTLTFQVAVPKCSKVPARVCLQVTLSLLPSIQYSDVSADANMRGASSQCIIHIIWIWFELPYKDCIIDHDKIRHQFVFQGASQGVQDGVKGRLYQRAKTKM